MKIPPGHAFPTSSMHVMGKQHKDLGLKKKKNHHFRMHVPHGNIFVVILLK